MNLAELTTSLKAQARGEGFDLVGIAAAHASDHATKFQQWLRQGMHGDMSYLETTSEQRCDPRLTLPDCRSVVVVAMSYSSTQPNSRESFDPDRAWVSRYAWGRDYHRLFKKRLIRIGGWLAEQCPGSSWRATVDTAPILERYWAMVAGIGWIGKNTQLINRDLGSELFLGALLTTQELLADAPATAHCGRCTACLDACPAAAFPRPHVLDARRCIGYLTVEHRGAISDQLTPTIGHHIAGCDICQEVCPWTRSAPRDLHPEFQPAQHRFRPLFKDIADLDEEAYRTWRQGSPLNRIPFEQFRRNVTIARKNALHSKTR